MVRVGLNMQMVMNAGMRDRATWDRLRLTAQGPIQLLAFGATPDMEALLDVVQSAAAASAPVPVQQMVFQPTPALAPVYHSESSLVAAPIVSYSYFDNAPPSSMPVAMMMTPAPAAVTIASAHQAVTAKPSVAVAEYTHAPGISMPGRVPPVARVPPGCGNGPKLVPRKVK